jgi:hypothetical protein
MCHECIPQFVQLLGTLDYGLHQFLPSSRPARGVEVAGKSVKMATAFAADRPMAAKSMN